MVKSRWIPIAAGLLLIGVLVVLISTPKPEDTRGARVAFYGDSYTLGTGASDVEMRWSTIISQQRGWDEFNPSENGLGFVNNRHAFADLPDLVIADDPQIVFITMGLNDNFSYSRAADRIKAQISDDLGRLSSQLPDARLIVVEPFWYTDERPESVEVIIGWVEDAAAAVGADYIGSRGIRSGWPPTGCTRTTRATRSWPGAWTTR